MWENNNKKKKTRNEVIKYGETFKFLISPIRNINTGRYAKMYRKYIEKIFI